MILTTHLVIPNVNLMILQEEILLYFKVTQQKAFLIDFWQSSNGVMIEEEILKEVIFVDI